MKFCKDCEHILGEYFCQAPENGLDMVNGKPLDAWNCRHSSKKCGPDAKFFQQKVVKLNWWEFLKRIWK